MWNCFVVTHRCTKCRMKPNEYFIIALNIQGSYKKIKKELLISSFRFSCGTKGFDFNSSPVWNLVHQQYRSTNHRILIYILAA